MELSVWNRWLQKIDESSEEYLESELHFLMTRPGVPFVERNLRLGYLYFAKDCLGAAASAFQKIASVVEQKKDDSEFIRENEGGIRILKMGYRIVEDGCGGYDVVETGCGSSCCAPLCCCFGAAAVMAVCGIDLGHITNCGGAGEPGCLDDFMNNCCRCCCVCVNCHWMDP